jgi:hypothetical protein
VMSGGGGSGRRPPASGTPPPAPPARASRTHHSSRSGCSAADAEKARRTQGNEQRTREGGRSSAGCEPYGELGLPPPEPLIRA